MIWTQGQNGGAPSPSSQRPQATTHPRAAATPTASRTRRVLPMPGSPATRTKPPDCSPDRTSASSMAASWAVRPTNTSSAGAVPAGREGAATTVPGPSSGGGVQSSCGSWARMHDSSRRRSGPGSSPSSSPR